MASQEDDSPSGRPFAGAEVRRIEPNAARFKHSEDGAATGCEFGGTKPMVSWVGLQNRNSASADGVAISAERSQPPRSESSLRDPPVDTRPRPRKTRRVQGSLAPVPRTDPEAEPHATDTPLRGSRPCFRRQPACAIAQQVIPHAQDRPPGPALSPNEAIKAMNVPEGFTVELVASEPDIVNPVAMTFDEKGRVWITESLEYPRKDAGQGARSRQDPGRHRRRRQGRQVHRVRRRPEHPVGRRGGAWRRVGRELARHPVLSRHGPRRQGRRAPAR